MSQFLYTLMKSLTRSERIHFKRSAKTHASKGEKNYLKIYDVFRKLKKYDKSALTNQFRGTTIDKYLSSEVIYLKEKILISLFNFNMNSSKRNQIHKGIIMVEVLAGKGFQKEALKKLKVIKKKAFKQEEFTWILRLIELEEMILFKEGVLEYKIKLEQLDQQRSEVIKIIQNLNSYHILRQELRELQFSKQKLTNDIGALKDLYINPLIVNSQRCLSIKAKEHWYYIQVLMNYLKEDYDTGIKESVEYIQFINQNIYLFDISKLLPALSNYIYHAVLNKNKYHFTLGEKLLVELSHKNEVSQAFIKLILYTRNLEFAYYDNDLKLMDEYLILAIGLIKGELDQFEDTQVQYLFLVVIRAAIVLEKNDLGMYYCNLWHRKGVLGYRKIMARLFSIIVHFELNYTELLKSEIILLKNLNKKSNVEKILIKSFYTFINSMLKYPDRKDILINDFQKELKLIPINNREYFSFIPFDYYQWSLKLN